MRRNDTLLPETSYVAWHSLCPTCRPLSVPIYTNSRGHPFHMKSQISVAAAQICGPQLLQLRVYRLLCVCCNLWNVTATLGSLCTWSMWVFYALTRKTANDDCLQAAKYASAVLADFFYFYWRHSACYCYYHPILFNILSDNRRERPRHIFRAVVSLERIFIDVWLHLGMRKFCRVMCQYQYLLGLDDGLVTLEPT